MYFRSRSFFEGFFSRTAVILSGNYPWTLQAAGMKSCVWRALPGQSTQHADLVANAVGALPRPPWAIGEVLCIPSSPAAPVAPALVTLSLAKRAGASVASSNWRGNVEAQVPCLGEEVTISGGGAAFNSRSLLGSG